MPPSPPDPVALLALVRDVASATDSNWGRDLARRFLERHGLAVPLLEADQSAPAAAGSLATVAARCARPIPPAVCAMIAATPSAAQLAARRRPASLPPPASATKS